MTLPHQNKQTNKQTPNQERNHQVSAEQSILKEKITAETFHVQNTTIR